MRVLEKMNIQQKKSLVWALLYDVRFVRAGKITSSYFKILETLLNIGIIENGKSFLDSDELIINVNLELLGINIKLIHLIKVKNIQKTGIFLKLMYY